jgi:hypothetical protein
LRTPATVIPPRFVRDMARRPRLLGAAVVALALLGAGAALVARMRHEVRSAVAAPVRDVRPLEVLEVRLPGNPLPRWGGPELSGLRLTPDGGWLAGAFGVAHVAEGAGGAFTWDEELGLPALSVSALTEWRGRPVVALRSGGLFVREGGAWRELRSGWGALEVRVLDETAGGELVIGAREGLFRAPFGAREVERLGQRAVRALVLGDGYVVAGGEDGLERWAPGDSAPIEVGDPWIESVALLPAADGARTEVWAVTATGVVRGPLAGPLAPVAGGERVTSAVRFRDRLVAIEEGDSAAPGGADASRLRWFGADGRSRTERIERAPRRLFADRDVLVADTADGAWWLTSSGTWRPVPWSVRSPLPAGAAHVTALVTSGERIVAGVFDGGLIERPVSAATAPAVPAAAPWRPIPGARAWGVNALLASGGATYVASLRGAARLVGDELTALEGPGAAFALAATDEGVAIGYGQGVLLPGERLLSAFHGLPGNQALALATADATLFVGTPSGLGAIRERKVRWRMATGDEKLPNPWVTALLVHDGALYVGTYGGGVARRAVSELASAGSSAAVPALERFPESERWKVNPGGLVAWNGRCYVATDGDGLFRASRDGSRFEPVAAVLPSRRVTALTATPQALYIGTDQGIAVLTSELE